MCVYVCVCMHVCVLGERWGVWGHTLAADDEGGLPSKWEGVRRFGERDGGVKGQKGSSPYPGSKGLSKLFLPSSQASSGQLERKLRVSALSCMNTRDNRTK